MSGKLSPFWIQNEPRLVEEARKRLDKDGRMPARGWNEISKVLGRSATQCQQQYIRAVQSGRADNPPKIEPPKDPLAEETERRDRVRKLREEQELLKSVAGERSLRAFLEKLTNQYAAHFTAPPPYKPLPAAKGETRESMAMVLSDWHSAEVISREGTRGHNEYNAHITAQRAHRVVSSAISIKQRLERSGWRFDELMLMLNGDMVPGTIHEIEKHTDAENIVLTVHGTGWILAQSIRDLAAVYPRVRCMCLSGNHGRLPDARRVQQKEPLRSWDTMVYLYAKAFLADLTNIEWHIPNAYSALFDVQGWTFGQMHGHDIKCFPSSTMIQSSWTMEKQIGDVQIGDTIINGLGQPAKVTDIYRKHYKGRLVRVECEQIIKPAFTCTPTHKVRCVKPQWIVNGEVPPPEWVRADLLSEGDYLAIPKPQLTQSVTRIRMADVPLHRPKHFKDRKFPDEIEVGEDLGLVLGWYLGDGSVSNNAVEVVFGLNESKWVEKYRDAVERLIGIRPAVLNQTKRNCHRVLVYSKALASLLLHLGGKGSKTKSLHESVFDWPVNALRMVLVGWVASDGHAYQRNDRYCYAMGVTSSPALARQMFWVALANGYHPAHRRTSRKYPGGARMMDSIVFYGDEGKELGEIAKENFTAITYLPQHPKQLSWLDAHGFYLVNISHVSQEEYDGEVVDLTVDPDHSYIVNNLSVHNSWGGIPFYGIQRSTRNQNALEAARRNTIHYWVISHFHSQSSLPQAAGEVFINGSLCGGTEFTVNGMGVADPPNQLMFGVHPEHGVTHRWPLYASTAPDAPAYDMGGWEL